MNELDEDIKETDDVSDDIADEVSEIPEEDTDINELDEFKINNVVEKLENNSSDIDENLLNDTEDDFINKRTLSELATMKEYMDIDGDSDVEQLAGQYKDIRKETINGEKGESHHIIPQSLVDQDKNVETTIKLEKEDHRELPTTGGVINRKYESFLPDSPKDSLSHSDEIKELIDNRLYAEAFRNELLDIKKNECDNGVEGKYNEAIGKALDAEMEYIDKYDVPTVKR